MYEFTVASIFLVWITLDTHFTLNSVDCLQMTWLLSFHSSRTFRFCCMDHGLSVIPSTDYNLAEQFQMFLALSYTLAIYIQSSTITLDFAI